MFTFPVQVIASVLVSWRGECLANFIFSEKWLSENNVVIQAWQSPLSTSSSGIMWPVEDQWCLCAEWNQLKASTTTNTTQTEWIKSFYDFTLCVLQVDISLSLYFCHCAENDRLDLLRQTKDSSQTKGMQETKAEDVLYI